MQYWQIGHFARLSICLKLLINNQFLFQYRCQINHFCNLLRRYAHIHGRWIIFEILPLLVPEIFVPKDAWVPVCAIVSETLCIQEYVINNTKIFRVFLFKVSKQVYVRKCFVTMIQSVTVFVLKSQTSISDLESQNTPEILIICLIRQKYTLKVCIFVTRRSQTFFYLRQIKLN